MTLRYSISELVFCCCVVCVVAHFVGVSFLNVYLDLDLDLLWSLCSHECCISNFGTFLGGSVFFYMDCPRGRSLARVWSGHTWHVLYLVA